MKPRFFPSPAQFGRWLARHHASARVLEVGFYKKASGRKSITYPEALDLALCYGWIDGVRHTVDDESYQIRFTPRRPQSKWSAVNLKHFARLRTLKLVKPAGLEAFRDRDTRAAPYSFETRPKTLGPAYQKKLKAHPRAWAFFQAQPPSYRRNVTFWVMSAKQEETRQRRLDVLIARAAKAQRIPPLAPARAP